MTLSIYGRFLFILPSIFHGIADCICFSWLSSDLRPDQIQSVDATKVGCNYFITLLLLFGSFNLLS